MAEVRVPDVQVPDVQGTGWLSGRRAALVELLASTDAGLASSSGCAASGAHRHTASLAEKAAVALQRLDAGVLHLCADCGAQIPWERLDALVTATRCAPCVGPGTVDTRWCR